MYSYLGIIIRKYYLLSIVEFTSQKQVNLAPQLLYLKNNGKI